MKQKVRKFQYVATPRFSAKDFPSNEARIACILPAGAAVLGVSVVVEATETGGTLNVGLDKSANFFLNSAKLDTSATHTSAAKTITKDRSEITITPNKALSTGAFSLIVEFALPTTYDYEV